MRLNEMIKMSTNFENFGEFPCDLELKINGKTHKAYTVSIAYRDLLFYCDKLTAQYDVNCINGENTVSLNEVIYDEEN